MSSRHATERRPRESRGIPTLDGLLDAFGLAPNLSGAACCGSSDWDLRHDAKIETAPQRTARLRTAAEICRTECLALAACRAWAATAPRLEGVVAGEIRYGHKRPSNEG